MIRRSDEAGWASHPLDGSPDDLIAAVESSFPVSLIATFKLSICNAHDRLDDILDDPGFMGFDYVPVCHEGEIIGLVDRQSVGRTNQEWPGGSAGHGMLRLRQSNLMSATDSILAFLQTADTSPCRLVLRRGRIEGIVTISDLQKLSVRPVLFLLTTHLELLMAQVIRGYGFEEQKWMSALKENRRKDVEAKWCALSEHDLAIDKLTATELCDKREIIRKLVPIPSGKEAFKRAMTKVESLRNTLAHSGDYAGTRESAEETIQTVKRCEVWIGHFREMLGRTERRIGPGETEA